MPRGPCAVPIELTDAEHQRRERRARRRRSPAGLAQRSRIVLACARGLTSTAVAEQLGGGVSVPTVRGWRARCATRRRDGRGDEPRPGRPRTISDEAVEDVIVTTLQTPPPDGTTHWSARQMAAAGGVNQPAVCTDLAGVLPPALPG